MVSQVGTGVYKDGKNKRTLSIYTPQNKPQEAISTVLWITHNKLFIEPYKRCITLFTYDAVSVALG